jgi:predicted nucleic acid-binding protein
LIALDTNILVYSVLADEAQGRNSQAVGILQRLGATGAVVPLQVIGEFLNVCRRKKLLNPAFAIKRATEFVRAFDCYQTESDDLLSAIRASARFDLQYFDALILTVAARAGATLLLSEDMHDGLVAEGVRIVNPFNPSNDSEISDYLDSAL